MVYSTRQFVLCLTLCHFVLVFFSPFSIAITSLGEEGADLSVFRTLFDCACYATDRSKAVVPVLVLRFVALWFILRGDSLYVFPCVILFLCFSVLLVLRLPRLGKRELILVLFVRLFDLCLFGFVGFLFLLGSGKAAVCDCGTRWTFLLPFFFNVKLYNQISKSMTLILDDMCIGVGIVQ